MGVGVGCGLCRCMCGCMCVRKLVPQRRYSTRDKENGRPRDRELVNLTRNPDNPRVTPGSGPTLATLLKPGKVV